MVFMTDKRPLNCLPRIAGSTISICALTFLLAESPFGSEHLADAELIQQWLKQQQAHIRPICNRPQIFKSLQTDKRANHPLQKILQQESTWLSSPVSQRLPLRFEQDNANVSLLKAIHSVPDLVEIIITDANGATLFAEPAPSDYWQGDEPKFQIPARTESTHIGALELDESTSEYSVQISEPVILDEQFLGVCTFTFSIPLSILIKLQSR